MARTYDFGHDPRGRCFLVMELLRGEPLEKIIGCVARPPVEWSISIVSQVLAGLGAAHDRGVIHRDVKPGNVVIETTLDDNDEPVDIAKLCDFGIAHMPECEALGDEAAAAGFDPNVCGTPNYMSPEQAQGEACTLQTDIYSCGVMLYELVTGRLPFDGPTARAIALKHVLEQAPLPSEVCPDIAPELERIILRAMAKRPEDRYPTARAMRAELMALECAKRHSSLLDDWADAPQPLDASTAVTSSNSSWTMSESGPLQQRPAWPDAAALVA